MKKYIVLGIVILFVGASIIPIISGNIEIEKTNTIEVLGNDFWKHENITHYNITNSFNLFAPERVLFGTAYNYNNFSIIPSGDSGFDPWLVWVDDNTGSSGAFEFEDVPYSNHGSCFLQIDTDGYIWVSRGGYADVVPFDLYKSNEPLSTSDHMGYTKKLDNWWTIIGACSPNVMILDDKVNLFFRNWWNDDPGTEHQQIQYDKDDFSAPLLDRQFCLSGLFQGVPIVPCYGWSRVDPRYNMGFLSFSFKLYSPNTWGSYPFIGVKNDGNTLVKGDDSVYSIPLSYQSNIDIPLDNIRQGIIGPTYGVNSGITPGGYYYQIVNMRYSDTVRDARMFIYRDSQWIQIWDELFPSYSGYAVGVTKDYTVLVYGINKELFVLISDDDCQTWTRPVKIVEASDSISGIAFAQPTFDYTDNIIRFFYGAHGGGSWSNPVSKYRFIKFNAERVSEENKAPSSPIITGEVEGKSGIPYDYTFTTVDANDDDVWLWVEWGDGTPSGWSGPFESGESVVITKTFSGTGTYQIKAKAKDIYEAESDWGILEVEMPVNQQIYSFPLLQRLLERFPNMFPILRYILGVQ